MSLEKFRNAEEFSEINADGKSILSGLLEADKNDVEFVKKIRKLFSPYLITISDLLSGTTDFVKKMKLSQKKIEEKYSSILEQTNPKPLYAYFKGKLQPKNPQGRFLSFYTGPAGEQPGMTKYYSGAKDRKRDSGTKTSQKPKNVRWKTIEEDLKWAVERDDALRMKLTKKGWELTSLKTGKEVTPDEEIGKILEKLEETYAELDSWIEAFGKLNKRAFWEKEWKSYYDPSGKPYIGLYPNVMKELREDFGEGVTDGATFIVNRFGKKYKDPKKRISLFEAISEFKRLQPIIQYYLLPLKLRDWVDLKYRETSKKGRASMFDKDDNITEKLIKCAEDYLKKARETDVVMVKRMYHASLRMRVPSHVGRGINQKDALFWAGQGFLEAYLIKEGASGVSEFPFFLFNEAMHVGNPTDVLHEKIEKPEDIGFKIEHMELSRYTELDKNWRKYITKPWEPMIGGVTVGKTDEIISAFDEIKSFAEGDFFGTLLVEGAIGTGKTQSREAITKFMEIFENQKRRVWEVSCAELPNDITELRHMFLGEKLTGGTFSPGILPELIKASQTYPGRSLLIIDELPDASPQVQNFLIKLLNDTGEIGLPNGEKLDLENNLKIVCYANKTIDDLPDNVFRTDLKERIGQTVKLPDLSKRGEDIVRLAEKFNDEYSQKMKIPWSPIDENLGEMIKNWVDFYARWSCYHGIRKIGMEIQVRTLEKFMKELVLTRKGLLDDLKTKGELRKKGKKLPVEQEVREIFSKDYLTIADVAYANTDWFFERKDYKRDTHYFFDEEKEIYYSSKKYYLKKYISGKPITPYFKELGALDGEGTPVALYTGPPGEQPGMTLSKAEDDGLGDDLENKFSDLAAVFRRIPTTYNNHGVDHKSLAEAFKEAPLVAELGSKKIGDMVMYMEEFVKKIFNKKCEVKIERLENIIKEKKIQEIIIDVVVDSSFDAEKKTNNIPDSDRSGENTYLFQIVFKQIEKEDGSEMLSVKTQFPHDEELVGIEEVHLSAVSIPKEGVTAMMQNFVAEMAEKKGVPEDIRNVVAENVVNFSKLNEKSALIFSETATFDKGLGVFLPKLARAGIKVAVVAPEGWQKDAITLVNKREKVEIVCLNQVEEALRVMPAPNYYYFTTSEDEDIGEIEGIISCDITDKIAIIIRALAEANHVTDVNTIDCMEQLAGQFRTAV